MADVLVVGGGVIGLSVAWHLACAARVSVVVLERARLGVGEPENGQASPAAAGMLAPLAEANAPGPLVTLGLASLERYPAFLTALEQDGGEAVPLAGPGMLRVATNEVQEHALCQAFGWQQRAAALPVSWLSGDAARRLEPALAPGIRAAVLSPNEKHVEPRRLVRALAAACARRGVRIVEEVTVTRLEASSAGRVTAARTASGDTFSCGALVVSGGAWSAAMGDWLGARLPVFPVRGQIGALLPAAAPPLIRHTVYAHGGYLVPRANGRMVVGATEEPEAGFEARTTKAGLAHLRALPPALVPALAGVPFESVWCGLRPATPDGLPLLGPLPGWDNVHVAAGHFRNGILLAPVTGEIVAHGLLNGKPHPLLAPAFAAGRFAEANS